jgi:leucyl aminopeptidase
MDKVRKVVNISATTEPGAATGADTIAVGIFEGEEAPAGLPGEAKELIANGEARGAAKAYAVAHAEGKRWLLAGLGKREEFTAERARTAAAGTHGRALELSTKRLCWQTPEGTGGEFAAALTEGTALADYRFDRMRSAPEEEGAAPKHIEELILSAPDAADAQELERTVAEAATVAEAVNAARDLQNRPANDLTPTALAEYARTLAEGIEGLTVKVEGREGIEAHGMGAFAAVAQGSEEEPALIVLRYEHPEAHGPLIGLVGKAVTFDSGGISLKPGAKMAEMKFDMSGGAAVVEAVGAIAKLGLKVRVVGVVGATENLPSGRAAKPGDIVRAANGKTIEINNTDAEGRLVLADCLHHAVTEGAERIVDLATLTGAVIVALGSTYAGLMANDDELARRIAAAGERSGEIVWRLPLHEEYDKLIEGKYGDLDNAPEARKAGTITGGAFLGNFVGETPWAHLDIAGTAWELERAYVGKGASGFGVRLLVEFARSYAE